MCLRKSVVAVEITTESSFKMAKYNRYKIRVLSIHIDVNHPERNEKAGCSKSSEPYPILYERQFKKTRVLML